MSAGETQDEIPYGQPAIGGGEIEVSSQFMALTTTKMGRYAIISCLVCFLFIGVVTLGLCALSGASARELTGVAIVLAIVMVLNMFAMSKGNRLPPRYRIPTSRLRPLMTVRGKFVEFDIPQLFLAQINSKSTIRSILGYKQRPLQSPYVTLVSACRWELTADRRRLFVTAKLPIWGPLKIRMTTEWDVPEFANDRWAEFVSELKQRAKN